MNDDFFADETTVGPFVNLTCHRSRNAQVARCSFSRWFGVMRLVDHR